jgi:hypothetical protein
MDYTAHVTSDPNGELTATSTIRVTGGGTAAHPFPVAVPQAPTWPDWAGSDLTPSQQRVIEALAGIGFRIDGPATRTATGLAYPVYRT